MKTIICDKCKNVSLDNTPMEYSKYGIAFGRENIFGNRGTIDLCEKCLKEFLGWIH